MMESSIDFCCDLGVWRGGLCCTKWNISINGGLDIRYVSGEESMHCELEKHPKTESRLSETFFLFSSYRISFDFAGGFDLSGKFLRTHKRTIDRKQHQSKKTHCRATSQIRGHI